MNVATVWIRSIARGPARGRVRDQQWQRTQEEIKLPPADPAAVDAGKRHMEIERQNIERAKQNDPRSRQSTITGPITTSTLPNPNKTTGDGSQRVGGVSLRGTTTTTQGHLDVASEAEKLAPPEKKSIPVLPPPAPKTKETN
jgi:hypothetical protein